MTECIPPTQCDGGGGSCTFAPQGTFTVADAARVAGAEYESAFFGKWHLGSLYNNSEEYGGYVPSQPLNRQPAAANRQPPNANHHRPPPHLRYTSSPQTHGFDTFNCTVEVAPTATTNAQCRVDWNQTVDFGHYQAPNHCAGGANPGGGGLPDGCCFNYWWPNASNIHGVSNLTNLIGGDDSAYVTDSFEHFVASRDSDPFLAQVSRRAVEPSSR